MESFKLDEVSWLVEKLLIWVNKNRMVSKDDPKIII
jgi:hypothetical protein